MRTYVTHKRFLERLEERLRKSGVECRLASVVLERVGGQMVRMGLLTPDMTSPVGWARLRRGDDGCYVGVLSGYGFRVPIRVDGGYLGELLRCGLPGGSRE